MTGEEAELQLKITELKNSIHHLEKCVEWYRQESKDYREVFLSLRATCTRALSRGIAGADER